jgi:hypothetical protein
MAALPQEWVKPEVDPPRIYALPRGVTIWQERALLEELDDRRCGSHLADPEEEHPLDDFGFKISHFGAEFGDGGFDLGADFRTILVGHEAFGKVILLFTERDFQALCNGTGLGWLDAGGFEDRKDFDRAHELQTLWAKAWIVKSRKADGAFTV